LSEETGLIIHYLSEWNRFLFPDQKESVTVLPIRTYKEFVRVTYAENQQAVSRILAAAQEKPLKELDGLRNEFNSLLIQRQLTRNIVKKYISRTEKLLRR